MSPFFATNLDDIVKNNEKCEITFPESMWGGVSEEAKDLVMKMTTKDPEKRISIEAALGHVWFRKDFRTATNLVSALENMKKYTYCGFLSGTLQ